MSFYVQFIFISLDEGQILNCMNLIFEKFMSFSLMYVLKYV